jgi:hypothetical protein
VEGGGEGVFEICFLQISGGRVVIELWSSILIALSFLGVSDFSMVWFSQLWMMRIEKQKEA